MSAETAKAPPAPPPTSTPAPPAQTITASAGQKTKPATPAASRTNSNTSNASNGTARRGGGRNRAPAVKKDDAATPAAADAAAPPASSAAKASTPATGSAATGAAANRRKSHSGQPSTGRNGPRPAAPTKQNSAPGVAPSSDGAAASSQAPRRTKSPAVTASAAPKGGRANSNSSGAGSKVTEKAVAAGKLPADKGSEMLDSLKRVITDLKSISSAGSNGQGLSPGSTDAKKAVSPKTAPAAPAPDAAAQTSPFIPSKVPNPNAPSFHPSRQPLDQLSEEAEHDSGSAEVLNSPPVVAPRHLPPGLQQQQPMGQFVAPRFQTLQKAAAAPAPVADKEMLGPTGRPVLAPTFTFGTRRQSAGQDNAQQPQYQPPAAYANLGYDDEPSAIIARSQSFAMGTEPPAQNVAPGMSALLGLAARAHRRTGSEMSPQMAQQVRLACAPSSPRSTA